MKYLQARNDGAAVCFYFLGTARQMEKEEIQKAKFFGLYFLLGQMWRGKPREENVKHFCLRKKK